MAYATEEGRLTQLPQNVEAERAFLGGLILDNRQVDAMLDFLPSTVVRDAMHPTPAKRGAAFLQNEPLFFLQANQAVFAAIMTLHEKGSGVDLTTLAEELERRGQLEMVGGPSYLGSLEEDLFSLGQMPQYAQIIVEKWRLRNLIRTSQKIISQATVSDAQADNILEGAERQIFEIAQQRQEVDFVHAREALEELMGAIEDRAKGLTELPGLTSGFRDLDRMTAGFRPANMVVLAARPSMGKTAFALNIATHVALHSNVAVGVFSLEMSRAELVQRVLCTLSRVGMNRVRGGRKLTTDELERLHEAAERLERAPLFIDDTTNLSPLEMRTRARKLKSQNPGLGLIILDYLQLMSGSGKYDNRQAEVSEISRSVKGLARELSLPIIALSQLSRQSEQRKGQDKLPRLSDLRESGAIEQDADLVLFIHRERDMSVPLDEDAPQLPELATIRVAKQRNGNVGDIEMLFRGQFTQFIDKAPGDEVG